MNPVCQMILRETMANYLNLEIAIRTYDRQALICGVPAWRYVYHSIHSADRWFFNPFVFAEPDIQPPGERPDYPDNPWPAPPLSDEQLLAYLDQVRQKTTTYLTALSDEELNACPPDCPYSRLELVLMQFRHLCLHVGMLHGQTIERTGRYPAVVGPDTQFRLEKGLFDE